VRRARKAPDLRAEAAGLPKAKMQPRRAPQQTSGTHRPLKGPPEPVRVRMLGGFSVSVGFRTIVGSVWRLKKAASLVKLLALSSGHRMHREQVMDMLWPDLGAKAAANNLRHALHVARRVFDPDPSAASSYLNLQGDQLALCPGEQLWVDLEAFEETAAAARRSKDPTAYRVAIELYSGELLPEDRYEEWAETRREELRRLSLTLLTELASLYEVRGEHEPAVEALRSVVAEEPTLEEAHAGLMRLYALSGRPGEAMAQYGRLCEVLSTRLDAEPSAATRRLRDEIAGGGLPPNHFAAIRPEEPPEASKHNLPAPSSTFIGREREMVEVKRTLAMTRLLTLTGSGGSGKTRLALEVGRDLVGVYPDGVWLVELAPVSEGTLVPQVVANALRVRELPGRPVTDTLMGDLKTKQMLLLLDNCEHLIDASAHLADTLLGSCPHLKILATSREPLGVAGEAIWRVPSLAAPHTDRLPAAGELTRYDAVRLFLDRARLRLPDFELTQENAGVVARMCGRLEGIPLAIELATARMGTLAVEQVAGRLEDSLGLLTGGSRTSEPRQRTLRATLDWSHGLLSEWERKLFRNLSAFAGGFTLEAAEAVGPDGVGVADILDLLSKLVDKSLVIAEASNDRWVRYRMLEPVKQYARERLQESEESDATPRRHAAFFLALAEEAEPELKGTHQEEWLGRLEAEHDNFRAALSWAMELGEAELGLRLGAALVEFWHLHTHHNEARRWLEDALAKGGGSPSARMKALERACFLAWELGDYERAMAFGEEGLVLARRLEDSTSVAAILVNLGSVAMSRTEVERASALLEEAVAMCKASGDDWGLAQALYTLGIVAVVRRDHARAMTLHEESLALARKSGDEVGIVRALGQGALTALVGGELRQADKLSKATMELSRRLGIGHYAASCLSMFGASAALRGHSVRAVRLWAAEESLRAAMGIPRMPAELSFFGPYVEATRTQLDDAAWETACSEGRAMDVEAAVEYALSEEESAPAKAPAPEEQRGGEPPGGLTRRQREVAALVARGLTNRQIAAELSISEHTVATHVGKIMRKLGLSSRSQLAAWVTEQGLPTSDSG
jgi:predicted ATPase/DNA-binding SARP family transcriptional activator/DNA-binding CsgD family transcriptional regulator